MMQYLISLMIWSHWWLEWYLHWWCTGVTITTSLTAYIKLLEWKVIILSVFSPGWRYDSLQDIARFPSRPGYRILLGIASPGTCVTKGYELMTQISLKNHVTLKWKIMIRICHNFAHAMTAELSWHVQNCDMIGWSESKLELKYFTQDFSYELINPYEMG